MTKARILIVDDEAPVRDVLRDILELEGYEVTATGSAMAALKEGRQQGFDLLLADIKMPGMDGLELTRRFRELNPGIPSVIITGFPSLETATGAIDDGAYDYIVKPIRKSELCAAVADALKKRTPAVAQIKEEVTPHEDGEPVKEPIKDGSGGPDRRLTPADTVATLRNADLFEALSDDELSAIADLCHEETYQENEAVYHHGEPSERLYVVREGAVALKRSVGPDGKASVTTDLLREGQVFGWTALIEPHVHTASAVCCQPTRVVAINGSELMVLLGRDPYVGFEVMRRLAAIVGSRMRKSYEALDSDS